MRKIILAAVAVASLAVPAVSMADQPAFTYKTDPGTTTAVTNSNGNAVGQASSDGIHNGTVVSQQAKQGVRSANVQYYLGTDGLGNGTQTVLPPTTYAPGSVA